MWATKPIIIAIITSSNGAALGTPKFHKTTKINQIRYTNIKLFFLDY